MLNLATITDKPDLKTFPFFDVRFPLWKRVLIHLMVPFMILIIAFKQIVLWRREVNGIKNQRIESQLSAVKNIAFCHDIPLEAVKTRCKQLGVTINDFIFGIISQSMKQCMEFHNDTATNWIRCGVPFSTRGAPKHELDFTLKNDFAILPVDMRLVSDLKSEIT